MPAVLTTIPGETRFNGRLENPFDPVIVGGCSGEIRAGATAVIAAPARCRATIRARVAELRGEVPPLPRPPIRREKP